MKKIFGGICTIALTATLVASALAFGDSEYTCKNTNNGDEVDVSTVCRSLSDADAAAFCGSLNINVTRQVCDPYVEANAFSLCKNYVDNDAEAYCKNYTRSQVDVEVKNRIDEITNTCGGDHTFTALAVKLGEIGSDCYQGQQQAAIAKNICEDSSVNSFDASQNCKQSTNVSVACPNTDVFVDEAPADCRKCKTKRKYFKDGTVKFELTRCKGCTFDAETSIVQD